MTNILVHDIGINYDYQICFLMILVSTISHNKQSSMILVSTGSNASWLPRFPFGWWRASPSDLVSNHGSAHGFDSIPNGFGKRNFVWQLIASSKISWWDVQAKGRGTWPARTELHTDGTDSPARWHAMWRATNQKWATEAVDLGNRSSCWGWRRDMVRDPTGEGWWQPDLMSPQSF